MEQQEYINRIVLPMFRTYASSSLETAVRGIDGELLFMTDRLARHIFNVSASVLLEANALELNEIESWRKYNLGFVKLVEGIKQTRKAVDFLMCDWSQAYPVAHVIATPLFLPSGEVFAYQSLHRPLSGSLVNQEIFSRHRAHFKSDKISLENIFVPQLDSNAQEVLALLLLRYSQQEIADYFKCSRSSVAKIIHEKLCPVLDVPGYSARLVVDVAVDAGLQYLIPKKLLFSEQL